MKEKNHYYKKNPTLVSNISRGNSSVTEEDYELEERRLQYGAYTDRLEVANDHGS